MVATLGDLLTYLGIILVGFVIWAALSPFEVLGWWAGWFGDKIYDDAVPSDGLVRTVHSDRAVYIVYLSGVGKVSGVTFSYREREFLRRLALALPSAVIIDDIFPYSVNNLALTGQPIFARLWRWALQRKLHGPAIAGYLINVRNIWQMMISADKRYGPMYNQAIAEVILHGLMRYDYDPAGDTPVYLFGYSGAGQVAMGTLTYLREWLHASLYAITLGGVFSSDPGVLTADHVYHMYGKLDKAVKYSMFAPGRWPILPASAWNRARRQGKVTAINLGPMAHNGSGGYLDAMSEFPDGTSFVDKTVQTVADIVHRQLTLAGYNVE